MAFATAARKSSVSIKISGGTNDAGNEVTYSTSLGTLIPAACDNTATNLANIGKVTSALSPLLVGIHGNAGANPKRIDCTYTTVLSGSAEN